ncbi:MotB family protein [Pannonibacter tanglangensis]|uniref:MotB family protein n=1 Tax=Pannonibacter tanglangensis TaxID=2750084 RepID=A0ABW9ZKE9_9HYPH|nr:MotB family protein [Pannonibacter sp. XCT-34]NBN64869.1 MotB family protein [Pannonibacter sp. XCT-34]
MSAELQPNEIVIVRRRASLDSEQVKNGVWKIAFADFMTAMMAFFLVMWLINVTDDSVRRGVAQYFNPVKLSSTTQTRKGLNDQEMPGPEQGKPAEIDVIMNSPPDPDGRPGAANGQDMTTLSPAAADSPARRGLGEFEPTHTEAALFRDPYAVLDQLADSVTLTPGEGAAPETRGLGTQRQEGAQGGEAFRDPFDPMYWQFLPGRETAAQQGGAANDISGEVVAGASSFKAPETATAGDAPARPAATGVDQSGQAGPENVAEARSGTGPDAGQLPAAAVTAVVAPVAPVASSADRPHDPSVLRGAEQADAAQPASTAPTASAAGASDASAAAARQLAEDLTRAMRGVEGTALGAAASHVEVVQQGSGVLISLTDDQDFGMFAVGSAEPRGELVKLMERIGGVLAGKDGRIVIRGHTDGRPFRSRDYDNWRLSTARAHMALYMLVRGGVAAERIDRVEGYADRDLKRPEDPLAPSNRRIEIFILEDNA